MQFTEKFDLVISTVEEYIKDPNKGDNIAEIQDAICKKLFLTNPAFVGATFLFVTDYTLNRYVKMRRIAMIIEELRRNELADDSQKQESIIRKYYSERSALANACKKLYGVTLSNLIKGVGEVSLLEPLTTEKIFGQNAHDKSSLRDIALEGASENTTRQTEEKLMDYNDPLTFAFNRRVKREFLREHTDDQYVYGLSKDA